jgi:hypothetical protein
MVEKKITLSIKKLQYTAKKGFLHYKKTWAGMHEVKKGTASDNALWTVAFFKLVSFKKY